MIAAHVAALRAELPRRGRWSRVLLAEAAQGLADAAEAYREAGLGVEEAERRAVGDFGPVHVVAPEFRREIGVRQALRTSRILCAVLPAAILAWSFAPPAPHGRTVLAAHLGGLALLTVLLAALALAYTRADLDAAAPDTPRTAATTSRSARRVVRAVGGAAMLGGGAVVAASVALPGPPALVAATALAAGAVTWSGTLCRRSA